MFITKILLCTGFTSTASAVVLGGPLPKTDLAIYGPIYQPAANASFEAFVDARAQATQAIEQVIATGNSTYGPFDLSLPNSFSASVFLLNSDEPIFEYHYEAPGLNGSYTKGKLTEDTIYRTGSLGKLMTIYTWLVDIGDSVFTDPITKYVVRFGYSQCRLGYF